MKTLWCDLALERTQHFVVAIAGCVGREGKSSMRMNRYLLALSVALMCYSFQSFAVTDGQQQGETKTTYLVIYRPGPGWLAGKPVSEQPLKEHGKYMLSLYMKGFMKLAGPLTDNTGGAVLLAVANESEAKALVTDDPAVKSGVFVYEMHPWKLQPWDEFAKKAKDAAGPVAPEKR